MDDVLRQQIELHIAGATAQHAGVYSNLEVPSSLEVPDHDNIGKLVGPFYMWGIRKPDDFVSNYAPIRKDVSIEVCRSLLVWLNWRPRIAAAYFAAIEGFTELEDHIGRLFLRSDVCYSGEGYALALAVFNTPKSISYIKKYLDHYLRRKDLWFDQAAAMAALHHLDRKNNTRFIEDYLPAWMSFINDKPNHDLDRAIELFESDVRNIERIKKLTTAQVIGVNGGKCRWVASLWIKLFRRV